MKCESPDGSHFLCVTVMQYNLFDTDILRLMKFGRPPEISEQQIFLSVMAAEYDSIASSFGCEVDPEPQKLLEAHEYWIDDLDSLGIIDSDEPDHYKHAGWLCHWLRKKMPIGRVIVRDHSIVSEEFQDYHNELTAFIIGLRLVLFHEACRFGYSDEMIVEVLKGYSYTAIHHDIAVFLSHKSVSPHSIYLVYRSLMLHSPFVGPS